MPLWRCEIAGEGAQQVTFEGPTGRVHADVHRGEIGRPVLRGLLSMSQPKQRLTLHHDYVVRTNTADPRLLGIHPLNGAGGDVILRLVDAQKWPKFLAAEIREIFEYKQPPGTLEQKLKEVGAEAGKKAALVPRRPTGPRGPLSEETKQKLRDATRERLAAKGIVMKDKTKKRRKRRRKKVTRGKRHHEGQQHLSEADGRDPQGDRPEPRHDAGRQEPQDLSSLVIQA